jgi:hypothetical protein
MDCMIIVAASIWLISKSYQFGEVLKDASENVCSCDLDLWRSQYKFISSYEHKSGHYYCDTELRLR